MTSALAPPVIVSIPPDRVMARSRRDSSAWKRFSTLIRRPPRKEIGCSVASLNHVSPIASRLKTLLRGIHGIGGIDALASGDSQNMEATETHQDTENFNKQIFLSPHFLCALCVSVASNIFGVARLSARCAARPQWKMLAPTAFFRRF